MNETTRRISLLMVTSLVNYLSPYNLVLAVLGQESVMLWLLVMGVNVQRWKEQTSAAVSA
jgi:hypothetical protein